MPRRRTTLLDSAAYNAARARVLKAAGVGAAHRHWYTAAQQHVADVARERGLPLLLVAAVYAATSPRCSPARNKVLALRALDYYQAGDFAGLQGDRWGAMPNHKVALGRVLLAHDCGGCPVVALNGPKTASFARNLAGDTSAVTVDVWACRSLGVEHSKVGGWLPYMEAAAVFSDVARALGWEPCQVQAAAWAGEQALQKQDGFRYAGEPGRNF